MTATARVTRPKTDRGGRTRIHILRTAEKLFGTKGYYGTSLSEIALKADVGHGTLYIYFGSKKDIFEELVKYLNHELRKSIQTRVSGLEKDRVKAEEVGLAAFFEFFKHHPHLYKIILDAEAVDPRMHKWYYEELAKRYALRLRGAMKSDQIRKMDPEALAYCLMGISHMLGTSWIVWKKSAPSPKALADVNEFVRHGLELSPGGRP